MNLLIRILIALFCSLVILQGCSDISLQTRIENADHLAHSAGWHQQTLVTTDFQLQSYYVSGFNGETGTIYIEGDGLAWISRTRPSLNPTPAKPVALELAIQQPGNVAYLARPCQYVTSEGCNRSLWTDARFSQRVVRSMNEAGSQIKPQLRVHKLRLVGYSGGGNIAALIVAQRDDVVQLVTVAGNLDHRAWTELQGVSPLTDSLNAKDFWQQLQFIPQIHFVGGKDRIVPIEVATSYQRAFPIAHKPIIRMLPNFNHHCCWREHWTDLMATFE